MDATYDLLLEIEKTRERDQIPIEGFLTSLNNCVANASNLYYSVKLMKYLDENEDKTETDQNAQVKDQAQSYIG